MNLTAKIRKLFIKPKYLVYRRNRLTGRWELFLTTENGRMTKIRDTYKLQVRIVN